MTEKLWLLPHVRRVDSITNFQHTYANGDEMIVRDLVEDPTTVTQQQADEAKAIALDRVSLVHSHQSPEADVTGVNVMFRLPGKNPQEETPMIVAETKVVAEEFRAAHPEIDLKLTGSVMINNQFAVSGQEHETRTPDIATNVRRDPADRVSWPSGLLPGVGLTLFVVIAFAASCRPRGARLVGQRRSTTVTVHRASHHL